jgi:Fe-S-cluster containining protein
MDLDFEPFFREYEALRDAVDATFRKVQDEYGECVRCEIGCADCCHALFDLTFIEALYIHHKYIQHLDDHQRLKLNEKANSADRQTYKIKRDAYKRMEAGEDQETILNQVAEERVRCPLLNEADRCDLYEFRPITCRLYGIPTAIGGKGHTCGLSGFTPGEPYPTVNMDKLHDKLYDISRRLVASIPTRHTHMADILVPLSMAMLSSYNEEYLGIKTDDPETPEDKEERDG